jgi:hypothetical protein
MTVKVANRVRAAVTVVATLIMVYALFVSRDHITHVAFLIGLGGYQASTLFVLVDLPALVGKARQLRYFAASTRRTWHAVDVDERHAQLRVQRGERLVRRRVRSGRVRSVVVIVFLVMENAVTKIKPAAAVTKARNAENAETPAPTARTAPNRTAAPRTPKEPVGGDALEKAYSLPSAPVSPAAAAGRRRQQRLLRLVPRRLDPRRVSTNDEGPDPRGRGPGL